MCGVHPMREKCRSNIWPKKKKKAFGTHERNNRRHINKCKTVAFSDMSPVTLLWNIYL